MVNGYTDERRTPKAKPTETLTQVVQLVNNDCRLNPNASWFYRRLSVRRNDADSRGGWGMRVNGIIDGFLRQVHL
jgi:hypothetical protein